MRYIISDDVVDTAVPLIAANAFQADTVGADPDPVRAVLVDFIHGFAGPRHLARLVELTRAGIGYGSELAGSTYDDDLEPGEEVFEGVLVTAYFRDDSVVMSRAAYARLVDAMAARPEPRR